jgi:hypothetical protein
MKEDRVSARQNQISQGLKPLFLAQRLCGAKAFRLLSVVKGPVSRI